MNGKIESEHQELGNIPYSRRMEVSDRFDPDIIKKFVTNAF